MSTKKFFYIVLKADYDEHILGGVRATNEEEAFNDPKFIGKDKERYKLIPAIYY